jgi:hypothetical protein
LSREAETWAWGQRWCGGRQKLVLLAIARFARGWTYHGGAERLAAETQLDVQAVWRAVRRLLETSYVTRPKRGTLTLNREVSNVIVPELGTEQAENEKPLSKVIVRELPIPEGSPLTIPLLIPAPKPSTHPPKDASMSKAPAESLWLTDLYRLGRAQANPLNEREVKRIGSDFGDLDIREEVEEFAKYWTTHKPQGGWVTYLRLRKWLKNHRNWEKERAEKVARANGSDRGIPADQDAYLKVLDWNKKRLPG